MVVFLYYRSVPRDTDASYHPQRLPHVFEQVSFSQADPQEDEQNGAILAAPLPVDANDKGLTIGGLFKEVLQVVLPAILLALAIHIFLAQATVVYGQSMQPNLQPSERLVIEKFTYYFEEPARNDIVVLDMPQMSELLIKRVVGLPGETVELRRGAVLINGSAMDQPYVQVQGGTTYGPITLGPNSYFVMGDNRNNSNDSRVFGPVSRSVIAGRAWMRYWPLNRFALFP
jgi:signal peptidase I